LESKVSPDHIVGEMGFNSEKTAAAVLGPRAELTRENVTSKNKEVLD